MSNSVTLRDIQDAIERLEDKMDARLNDHEERIRTNESFRYKVYGYAGAVSIVAGSIVSFIIDFIKRK